MPLSAEEPQDHQPEPMARAGGVSTPTIRSRRSVRVRMGVVVGLALAAASAVFGVAAPGNAQSPGSWGEIVYGCVRPDIGANWNGFCAMQADGSGRTPIAGEIVANGVRLGGGKVSPDGTKIAFATRRDDLFTDEIYVMNADGSGQTRLTDTPANNTQPAWLADGTTIAFVSVRDGNTEIYTVKADGTGEIRLTDNPGVDTQPTGLPDGRIGFASRRGDTGAGDIYVMNADGSGATNVTNNPTGHFDVFPDWSPDGTRVAYLHQGDVWVMNADASGRTNLTNEPGVSKNSPRWSPDGTRIAYTAGPSPASIWVMNADGSARTNIAPDPVSVDSAGYNYGEGITDWHPLTGPPPPPPTTTTTTTPPQPVVDPAATFEPNVTYPTGEFNPWQVAVADFNGDGNRDMAVAAPLGDHYETGANPGDPEGDVAVLLGTGDGTFGAATNIYAGFAPRSVAVGDFNEDGKADLAVANAGGKGSRNVSLLLGAGDGTFAAPVFFDDTGVNGNPHSLVVDDMNGDGFDDVVVASFRPPPVGGDVSVLLGTGTGSLNSSVDHWHSGNGLVSVATGDFNEDGRRDVVTTNLLASPQSLAVFFGVGGGYLADATYVIPAGVAPNYVTVGDFNADGFDDLATTMVNSDAVSVQLGRGDGTFGTGVLYPVGSRPMNLTVSDLNGDGRQDLAVANAGDATVAASYTVSVLLGTGTGAFGAPLQLPAGVSPFGVTAADLNNDSWPDLAVANNGGDGTGAGNVSVLLNITAPPPPVQPVTAVTASAYGYYTNVAMFGGDPDSHGPAPTVALGPGGGTEVATDVDGAQAVHGPAFIFEATGPIAVSAKGATGPHGYVTANTTASGVGPGPFTAEHLASSCVASATATGSSSFVDAEVVLQDPDQNVDGEPGEQIVQLPTNPAPNTEYSGKVANANDDFRIVFNQQIPGPDGSLTVNAVHMYLLGPRAVGEMIIGQATCGASTTPANRPAVDFDGDATSDVGVYRPSTGVWYLDHSTAPDVALAFGATGDVAVPADYDGDAKVDVGVYRPSSGVWYLNQTTAGGSAVAFGTGGDVPVPADYDGDAKADLAVYRPSTGVWYLHQTTAGGAAITFGGVNGDIPAVGDYDGDAKADLAIFRPSSGVWYLNQTTAGGAALTFGVAGDIPVPADFDGDDKADIAVFRPSSGVWYRQLSTGGGAANAFGTAGDVPVLGDYDGDGKVDIGVYRPSTSVWYLHQSTDGQASVTFGASGDVPLGLPTAIYRSFFF